MGAAARSRGDEAGREGQEVRRILRGTVGRSSPLRDAAITRLVRWRGCFTTPLSSCLFTVSIGNVAYAAD